MCKIPVPVGTFLIIKALCLFTFWFRNAKLGQNIRAVGQNITISEIAGIDVRRNRIASVIISTVLAYFGQIIYLQNIGTLINL